VLAFACAALHHRRFTRCGALPVLARRLVTALVTLVVVAACGSSTENGPQPAHVIVAPDAVTIPQKGTAPLSVSVTDQNDQLITGAVVTFSSSNTQILTVSNLGLITSVGPAGTANILAKAGRATTTVPVTVSQVTAGISVTPDPATLDQKKTLQLQAQVVDAVGTPIPGAAINFFTSGFTNLITVSSTGLITSLGPAGTTSLTLTTQSLTRTISVVVNQVASDLLVAPSSIRVAKNGKAQLVATIVDAVGAAMPSGSVTWTSNNQAIVTVSSTGVVSSVGPLGSTTITVKSGIFTRTVGVEVADISRPSGTTVTTASFNGSWGLGISSNGAIVAPGSDGTHTVMVDPLGAVLPTNGSAGGIDVTFNSAGTTAYVANHVSNRIDIIDIASNAVTGNFPVVQPIAVQMSRDDQTLYVGSGGLVVAYDVATKAEKTRITVRGTINAMTLHPSLPLLYVTGFEAGTVTEINTSTNTATRTFQVAGTAQEAVVTPNGSTLYVAIEGGDLAMFDLGSGIQGPSISGAGGFGAALTPDGLELWVVGGSTLKMVDLGTRTVRTLSLPTGGRRIVFSNDASVAVITQDGSGFMFVR
jgi:YVTN family beta-propeller protein